MTRQEELQTANDLLLLDVANLDRQNKEYAAELRELKRRESDVYKSVERTFEGMGVPFHKGSLNWFNGLLRTIADARSAEGRRVRQEVSNALGAARVDLSPDAEDWSNRLKSTLGEVGDKAAAVKWLKEYIAKSFNEIGIVIPYNDNDKIWTQSLLSAVSGLVERRKCLSDANEYDRLHDEAIGLSQSKAVALTREETQKIATYDALVEAARFLKAALK